MKACKLTGEGGTPKVLVAILLKNSSSIKSAIEVNCHSGCPGVQNVAMIQLCYMVSCTSVRSQQITRMVFSVVRKSEK